MAEHKTCYLWLHFQFQPVPEARLNRAKEQIKKSLDLTGKLLKDDEWWKNKVHCAALHILDDCSNHGTHLEALSAYPFENFHIIWKSLLRSGNKPLEQIRFDNTPHSIIFTQM